MTRLMTSLAIGACVVLTSVASIAAPRGPLVLDSPSGSARRASFRRIFTFDDGAYGSGPVAALTLARDGNLYGLTNFGGPTGGGTMYRVSPGGAVRLVTGIPHAVGASPNAGLTLGPDGLLYGTTRNSYTSGGYGGTIFTSTLTGTMTALYAFDSNVDYNPGKVTFDKGGALYGILALGPAYRGSAYKLTRSGPAFLTYFNDLLTGYIPNPLTVGFDGNLYGSAYSKRRTYDYVAGSAFRLTLAGRTTLALFTSSDPIGAAPINQLTIGPDGAFYGVTEFNTVYRLTTSGSRALVADLKKALPPAAGCTSPPLAPDASALAVGRDGQLYGAAGPCVYRTTLSGAVTLLAIAPGAGAYLEMPAFGSDGQLYGNGFDNNSGAFGFVYEITVK